MANIKTYFDTASSVNSVSDDYIIVVQTASNASLATMAKADVGLIRKPIMDMIAAASHALISSTGNYVYGIEQDASGVVTPALKSFQISQIKDHPESDNAPTSLAVKNYVEGEITGAIANNIKAAINNINATAKGGDAKYIKSISQSSGVISAVEENLATEINAANASKVPVTSAVKNYVDTKVNNLVVPVIGDSGKLIQTVSENAGILGATTIDIDTEISNNASKIPTSKAVYDKVQSLAGGIGNDDVLLQSVKQTGGKISSGATIAIDKNDITEDDYHIPTSKVVKNEISEDIAAAIAALEKENVGGNGQYIYSIEEEGGIIFPSAKDFESSLSSSPNAPSASAVKAAIEAASSAVNTRIDGLNSSSTNSTGDGYFTQTVSESSGAVIVTRAPFFNSSLATYNGTASSSSYAQNANVAPTVTAVTDQIKRLDVRIDNANAGLTNLSTGPIGQTGSYIETIKQTAGLLSASSKAFLTTIPTNTGTTSGASTPPTADAVRKAINAINANSVGSSGSYLKAISQSSGIISAASQAFDKVVGPTTGTNAATDNNAPTSLAVRTAIENAKAEILEESEAMTYIGSVASVSEIESKAAAAHTGQTNKYDVGDTYISNSKFNLAGTADPKYEINNGDMLIVNANSVNFDKDKFDIIHGSDKTVLYSSKASTAINNIPVFSDTNGRGIVDSGESINTIIQKTAAASQSASSASLSASYAASSADFAQTETQQYIETASAAASYSASYASVASKAASNASSFANNASTSASYAGSSAKLASNNATAASDSASYAGSSAKLASNNATAASTSASYAGSSATAASTSTSYAGSSATAASTSASYAGSSASLAKTSASYAGSSASLAKTSASYAGSSASLAKTSASYAGSSATLASTSASYAGSSATLAKTSASYAGSSATLASTSASYAGSSATAASTSAYYAGSSATAASTSASYAGSSAKGAENARDRAAEAADNAEAFASQANLERIRESASYSASYAGSSATVAKTSASYASSSATAASGSASYASSSAKIASNAASYVSSFATYSNLSSIVTTANQSASYSASFASNSSKAAKSASEFETTASQAASHAASYAASANLIGIKNAAASSASYASSSATLAYTKASCSASSANNASSSANYVSTQLANYWNKTTTSTVALATTKASFAGMVEAQEFNAWSSKKLKENVKPTIISALDLIDTVNIVDFNYIADSKKTPHIGFIAEDTNALLSTPEQNRMDYTNCIGTLIKAVQEITKGMSALEKEIKELKK